MRNSAFSASPRTPVRDLTRHGHSWRQVSSTGHLFVVKYLCLSTNKAFFKKKKDEAGFFEDDSCSIVIGLILVHRCLEPRPSIWDAHSARTVLRSCPDVVQMQLGRMTRNLICSGRWNDNPHGSAFYIYTLFWSHYSIYERSAVIETIQMGMAEPIMLEWWHEKKKCSLRLAIQYYTQNLQSCPASEMPLSANSAHGVSWMPWASQVRIKPAEFL